MYFIRQTFAVLCVLLGASVASARPWSPSDSLQHVLAQTMEPKLRVQLLLDLKDLNKEGKLEIPYSIRLFREAADIGDTYAMTVAITPIIDRYANYSEKEDSLRHYLQRLSSMVRGTPEEGFEEYVEMAIGYHQLSDRYDTQQALARARKAIQWDDSMQQMPGSVYQRAKQLLLRACAETTISLQNNTKEQAYAAQADRLREAYDLTRQMPNLNVRKAFTSLIYFSRSIGNNLSKNFNNQKELIEDYLSLLDKYYADSTLRARRPYLYTSDSYSMPYQQLMLGAYNSGHTELPEKYLGEFRRRMLDCDEKDLLRNKALIYEIGYLWYGMLGYEQVDGADAEPGKKGIQYCDSLIRLAMPDISRIGMSANKMSRIRLDHARLLYITEEYEKAYGAFDQNARLLDSIIEAESHERSETIRLHHDMDRRKLKDTRAVIRNRAIVTGSFVGIGLLLACFGIYLYRMLRANKRLQSDIHHHRGKALESERMKSVFVNTICRGIAPPLSAIDRAAQELMIAGADAPSHPKVLEQIRTNTKQLLSTLDNMLEASNLDSLSDKLQMEESDIDELCRAEVILASRLHENSDVGYIIEAPGTHCSVHTHAKYFAFVIRALLDNARKFTEKGSIVLRYELHKQENKLCVSVTDTGCGIPKDRYQEIFRPLGEHSTATHGLSLSLCCQIAEHLSGTIVLDETYEQGARFLFTIPIKP